MLARTVLNVETGQAAKSTAFWTSPCKCYFCVTVKLGEYEFTVGLSLFRWPNGGSWSFFVCPCGRRARIIRLSHGDSYFSANRMLCFGSVSSGFPPFDLTAAFGWRFGSNPRFGRGQHSLWRR